MCLVVVLFLSISRFVLVDSLLFFFFCCFFCQAEDGIRDLVRSRGLGDVYKRQPRGGPGGTGMGGDPPSPTMNRTGVLRVFHQELLLSLIHI